MGFALGFSPRNQDNPKLCVKSTSFSDTQRLVQVGSLKFRDFRTLKEALLGEEEVVLSGMDGKAGENDPRDMLVKVIDLAPGAGSVVMDNALRSICIKEAEMTWKRSCLVGSMKPVFNVETIQEALRSDGFQVEIKVSTMVFEEEQLFIDDVFPANNQSYSDGDALDSEFEYDGCSNDVVVPEGRSKPVPEKVDFDDQGCGSRDSFLASHVDSRVNKGVLEPNGPNLFDVNVVSGGSTELGNNSGLANKVGPVSNALLDLSDSISHRSRLQEVHVGILEVATGQNLGSQDLSGERKSYGLNLRVGFDKFNWWVAQSKRKSKAKKIPRSTSHVKKQCVMLDSSSGREPLAICQEQSFGLESRSPSEEAYKTLKMGTRVGVQFAVPRSRVVEKLVELDENL
ncbi:hypothetical protein V6N12_041783 [Hibiscus sabdariffa]|uniref:Uncharacterized protein n=1 Tax=Hibiscus sabdariffa TaxID=183260 RepID=A0ABR2AXC8_9ROSI